MKALKIILLCALFFTAVVFTACGGGTPPPVTKSQFQAAEIEAAEAATRLAELQREQQALQAELDTKTEKLEALREWAAEKK